MFGNRLEAVAFALDLFLLALAFWDLFETIVVPRPTPGWFRIAPYVIRGSWRGLRAIRDGSPRRSFDWSWAVGPPASRLPRSSGIWSNSPPVASMTSASSHGWSSSTAAQSSSRSWENRLVKAGIVYRPFRPVGLWCTAATFLSRANGLVTGAAAGGGPLWGWLDFYLEPRHVRRGTAGSRRRR